MSEQRSHPARVVSTAVVLVLLGATIMTSLLLWFLGDWEKRGWGLTLTLRILWGCWAVTFLATVLTRVTIFGWNFRRYFRWAPGGEQRKLVHEAGGRLIRAPWYKSGAASFSITVVLVSLTGVACLTTAVLWILEDLLGREPFWLAVKIIWSVWWVACIGVVLTRVAIFGVQRSRALREQARPPADPPQPAAPARPENSTSS
jgi:hypothetical protein